MTAATKHASIRQGRPNTWRWVAGGLAVAFGLATLVEGGQVLFGGPEALADRGPVVPFVVRFTFGAGFVYVTAGVATLAGRTWAIWLARALAASTLLVFAAFGVHVLQHGAFAGRTVAALTFRTLFWVVQSLTLPALLRGGRAR